MLIINVAQSSQVLFLLQKLYSVNLDSIEIRCFKSASDILRRSPNRGMSPNFSIATTSTFFF